MNISNEESERDLMQSVHLWKRFHLRPETVQVHAAGGLNKRTQSPFFQTAPFGSSMVNTDADDGNSPTIDTGNHSGDIKHKVSSKLPYHLNYRQKSLYSAYKWMLKNIDKIIKVRKLPIKCYLEIAQTLTRF